MVDLFIVITKNNSYLHIISYVKSNSHKQPPGTWLLLPLLNSVSSLSLSLTLLTKFLFSPPSPLTFSATKQTKSLMSTTTEQGSEWEEVIRKMLPAGAPLPDEDHLDYSIAVEYEGPPIPYEVPRIDPLNLNLLPTRASSLVSTEESKSKSSTPVSKFTRFSNQNGTARRFYPARVEVDEGNLEKEEEIDRRDEGRRGNAVTFNTPKDSETEEGDEEDDGYSSTATDADLSSTRKGVRRRKGGVCSRCGKKNRWKERESCLACEKRYCSNCLLKAMGSMPEGRKCVSCIGKPIDESKRSILGKCSRILARVCSPLEVRQIMKAEKECAANQLRPEQLIVNGRQLRQEELAEVLGCAFPPQKLKPGKYWYDKDSGLWGKVKERMLKFYLGFEMVYFFCELFFCY